MLRSFYLHEPATVEEANRLLVELGDEARIYAGGTELLLLMKEGLARFRHLINIKGAIGLVGIESTDSALSIGACTTHRDLEDSAIIRKQFSALAEMEGMVANIRVRNVGTLGGNLCFAEPHSDPAILLLTHDALLDVTGLKGKRTLPLEQFVLGPLDTALESDEILTRIRVPRLTDGMRAVYLKFAHYERPTVGVACALKLDNKGGIEEVRFAVGAVGDKPVRLRSVEESLRGKDGVEAQTFLTTIPESVSETLGLTSDMYGSVAYKRHLVVVYLRRAFEKVYREIKGESDAAWA